jgi:threonine/homoserine/homoserine lactone efflux protein
VLEAIVAGVVAGLAIAVPVGAIAILIIHTGLTRGLRAGLAAAFGAATADGIYATVAALAGAGAQAFIGPLIPPLRIVGGLVLVALGARGLLGLRSPRSIGEADVVAAAAPSHRRTYAEILGLTLLNPATIIYFAALTFGLPILNDTGERLAFAAAAFAASITWQSGLALFGAALGRGVGHLFRRPTVLIGNVVVIGLGVLVLVEGLRPPS